MPDREAIDQQQELLLTYRRALADWLIMQVRHGISTPHHVLEEIRQARTNIRRIKSILRDWGAPVENLPNDEPDDYRVEQSTLNLLPGSPMPDRNALFVGRTQILQDLANLLCGDQIRALGANDLHTNADLSSSGPITTVAIIGIGGIGKTQLAAEFAYCYKQRFEGSVFWLNFADPNTIPLNIAYYGSNKELNLRPDFATLPLEEQTHLVLAEWHKPVSRLLVFDNCQDERLIKDWRPRSGGCRVLITSRRAEWDPALGVHRLPLDVLNRTESIELLHKHRSDLDARDTALFDIAAELGDLPLALRMAGTFLRQYRYVITPAMYLEQLRHPDLLADGPADPDGAPLEGDMRRVAQTFALSYNQLNSAETVDKLALKLLACAAYFPPDEGISRTMLRSTIDLNAPNAIFQIENALTRLVNLGLLENAEDGTLRLHRLLSAFVRTKQLDKEPQTAVFQALLGLMRAPDRPDQERRTTALLLKRLRWLNEARSIAADDLIAYLDQIVRYIDSPEQCSELLKSIDRALTTTLPERQRAQLLIYGAAMHGQLDNLSAATEYYDRAKASIEDSIKSSPPQSSDLKLSARINLGLANIACIQAEAIADPDQREQAFSAAVALYKDAARAAHRFGGDTQLEMTILKELIYTYTLSAQWTKARAIYRHALRILKGSPLQAQDRIAYTTCYAQLLETVSQMHFERAKRLSAEQDSPTRLDEYRVAYQIAQQEISILNTELDATDALVLIHDLALAHINAGDYLWELSRIQSHGFDNPCRMAREHWEHALELAQQYGISDRQREAVERLAKGRASTVS